MDDDEVKAASPRLDITARADLAAVRKRLFPTVSKPEVVRVDRFVVRRRLGEGAMGVVFEAWDPKLDRAVALKLLRGTRADVMGPQRLVREAKALAKLRHPNVVTVHDVGSHQGEVFMTMDLVDGSTLRQWLQAPRTSTEIVQVCLAAGRGLAAVHDAGMVHRDFKPDNVLVATDGHPLVADFGVARVRGQASADLAAASGVLGASTSMTRTGALIGTPAYMAPEQLEGQPADARSDQFAFAVTACEALTGTRPFPGETPLSLLESMEASRSDRGPVVAGLPRVLRSALTRALAHRPEDRFASMAELLDAIEQALRHARQRRLALGALGAIGLGAAATWTLVPEPEAAPFRCEAPSPTLGDRWTPEVATRVREAFAGVEVPYAAQAAERVQAGLDAYARDHAELQLQACQATHERGERSTHTLELQVRCLGRRDAEVEGLLSTFAEPNAAIVQRAADAVGNLTPISACADVEALERIERASPLPDDPETRRRIETLRRNLARVRSAYHAGDNEEGVARSRVLLDEALALGHRPSIADAHYRIGSFVAVGGDAKGGAVHLEQAFVDSLAGGDDATAGAAAATLAHVVGVVLRQHDDGEHWARISEALTERLGNPPELVGRTAQQRGNVALLEGEYAQGRTAFARATEAFGEAGLEGERGEALTNWAVLEQRDGQYEAAERLFGEAEPLLDRVYGRQHPRRLSFLNNLAAFDVRRQRWDDAEAKLDEARALAVTLQGPKTPALGHIAGNLGEVYAARGRHAEALASFQEAIDVWQPLIGEQHPLIAYARANRALALHALGRDAQARTDAQAAIDILQPRDGAGSDLGRAYYALALSLPPDQVATAHEHMRAAKARLTRPDDASTVAEIDAWLQAHGGDEAAKPRAGSEPSGGRSLPTRGAAEDDVQPAP